MKLYNYIIEQCDFGDNSANLYEYLVEVNLAFLRNDIVPRVNRLPTWAIDSDYISTFAKAWRDFTLFVKLMERAFDYMNRYCINNLGKTHLTELAFFAFKSEMFWPNRQELVSKVVACLRRDHRNQHASSDDLNGCIQIFVDFCIIDKPRIVKSPEGVYTWTGQKDMALYTNIFERNLINMITLEYTAIFNEKRANTDVSEYILSVIGLNREESTMCNRMLMEQTKKKLSNIIVDKFIN